MYILIYIYIVLITSELTFKIDYKKIAQGK